MAIKLLGACSLFAEGCWGWVYGGVSVLFCQPLRCFDVASYIMF